MMEVPLNTSCCSAALLDLHPSNTFSITCLNTVSLCTLCCCCWSAGLPVLGRDPPLRGCHPPLRLILSFIPPCFQLQFFWGSCSSLGSRVWGQRVSYRTDCKAHGGSLDVMLGSTDGMTQSPNTEQKNISMIDKTQKY